MDYITGAHTHRDAPALVIPHSQREWPEGVRERIREPPALCSLGLLLFTTHLPLHSAEELIGAEDVGGQRLIRHAVLEIGEPTDQAGGVGGAMDLWPRYSDWQPGWS